MRHQEQHVSSVQREQKSHGKEFGALSVLLTRDGRNECGINSEELVRTENNEWDFRVDKLSWAGVF